MPCSDPGTPTASDIPNMREKRDKLKSNVEKLQNMLIKACDALATTSFDFEKNPELSRFYDEVLKERQEEERKNLQRKNRQAYVDILQQKPVSELTSEQKKILRSEGKI